MKQDKQGRPYSRLSELTVGATVTVDGDFPCLKPWTQHVVKQDGNDLYIECKGGKHHLAGQQDDAGDHCTGIYAGVVEQHIKKSA